MSRSSFRALVLAASSLPAFAEAQVPDGHWVVSAYYSPSSPFPGPGGLYVAHPRDAGACMTPITGLPGSLTGSSGAESGANCVLVHPGGDLLVGEIAPNGGSVGVWRLALTGLQVSSIATRRFALGTANAPTGAVGQVAQMFLLDEDTLLLGCSFVAGLTGPTDALQVVALDLRSGARSTIASVTGLGALNAMTCDPASGRIFCGAWRYVGGVLRSMIYELQPGASPRTWGAPLLRSTLTQNIAITGLAVADGGGLWATFDASSNTGGAAIGRYSASWAMTPLLTGWALANGIAVEPATGELAFVGIRQRNNTTLPNGVHRADPATGSTTWLSACLTAGARGGITGVACVPDPRPYGSPSGAAAITWSRRPIPDGLPVGGSTWTATVELGSASVLFSQAVVGFGDSTPLALPGLGIQLLLDPVLMLPVAVPMTQSNGRATLSLTIPAFAAGTTLFWQSLHGTATGLAASDGLRMTIL